MNKCAAFLPVGPHSFMLALMTDSPEHREVRDEDLMLRAAAGDLDAFGRLVEKYQQPLLNFFYRMGVYRDTEDLVQETMIKLFKARKRYRPKAKFSTYLFSVARNVWIDRGRKEKRKQQAFEQLTSDAELIPTGSNHGPTAASVARLDVREAMEALSEKLRIVVALRIDNGMAYEDMARVLRIPLGTVKSRMNLALQHLRSSLE